VEFNVISKNMAEWGFDTNGDRTQILEIEQLRDQQQLLLASTSTSLLSARGIGGGTVMSMVGNGNGDGSGSGNVTSRSLTSSRGGERLASDLANARFGQYTAGITRTLTLGSDGIPISAHAPPLIRPQSTYSSNPNTRSSSSHSDIDSKHQLDIRSSLRSSLAGGPPISTALSSTIAPLRASNDGSNNDGGNGGAPALSRPLTSSFGTGLRVVLRHDHGALPPSLSSSPPTNVPSTSSAPPMDVGRSVSFRLNDAPPPSPTPTTMSAPSNNDINTNTTSPAAGAIGTDVPTNVSLTGFMRAFPPSKMRSQAPSR
jgi:hypothetical protein